MSDLLELAGALRKHTDEQLVELLTRRNLPGSVVDFLDLAQVLLAPKAVTESIRKLSADEVAALRAIYDGSTDRQPTLELLGLAVPAGQGSKLPDPVATAFQQVLTETNTPKELVATEPAATDFGALAQAAIAFFETQQALTELILDVDQNHIRLVGKSGIGIGDVKRLATQLDKDNAHAKLLYRTAIGLRLIQLSGARWWLTPAAEKWLRSNPRERFETMAAYWVAGLGTVGAGQLHNLLASGEKSLSILLARVFPLANHSLDNHLAELEQLSTAIGLASDNRITELLPLVIDGHLAEASKAIARDLPKTVEQLIVQADLSLIAPGPLATEFELKIRNFASVEQIGLASSYRLSPATLSHALECGDSIDEIRALLTRLSGKVLPQPVEYLLREAQARFARLRISEGSGEERSRLQSNDALLLTEVLNDSRLRPFALRASNAATVTTRFEPDVLYFGLRDIGYVAVLVDSAGKVLSPRKHKSWRELTGETVDSGIQATVQALRSSDLRVGQEPDDQDLVRQLQLAIKTKSTLVVTVTDRSGAEVDFRVLPTSLANGRLRALDRKADAERTLPVDRIVRLSY